MKPPRLSRALYALALAAAFGMMCQLPARAATRKPGWIADPRTGCKVWDPMPQPHEAVHWSGGCKNGYADGKGTLQWIENGEPGERYDGEYRNGKRNGRGVLTEQNGTRIKGDWLNGRLLQLGVNQI